MYFPVGWPRVLKLPPCDGITCQAELKQVVCNRDKILTAIITSNALQIWYVKPCVPIISHRRPPESIEELGENVLAQWRPDSSMICVVTSKGHLIIYHIVVPTDIKTLYEQVDTPASSMKRESDELFLKELIPPLIFSLAFEVDIEGGVSDLVAIREELMIATTDGRDELQTLISVVMVSSEILRFSWDGQEIRDYSLDLRRIPFCVDQQVLKAVPLADKGAFVTKISYSPLLGGYAIVLNDGRAAFLVASSNNFDPNSVTGIWTPGVDDATCVALNHKYKLMAFGRKNSQGAVFGIDEMSGGLALSHKLVLKTRDYPGNPGEVTCLKWTPDGTALAMTWSLGGFSLWSTFGSMIMCSLCWDYGIHVSDPVAQNPVCVTSLDWSAEGYQMWLVNASKRPERPQDPEFMPFPTASEDGDEYRAEKERQKAKANPLANKALIFQFVKSPISVNPGMTKQEHIYLQGEDRLYLNLGQTREFNDKPPSDEPDIVNTSLNQSKGNISLSMMSSGSKLWTTISIPHTYMGSSWPIRFTSLDSDCQYLAVAGRTGLAHYSVLQRKWRLFGNETQEKDFIVTGGLLWWKDFIIVGCYNLAALHDEVRIYPRNEKLDNVNAKMWKVETQVLLLNLLNDLLVVFCADNQIKVYNLNGGEDGKASSLSIERVRTFDVSNIPGLAFHPACVILVALTNLRTETALRSSGGGNRDSLSRDSPTNDVAKPADVAATGVNATPSIILNICGRVVMIQTEAATGDQAAEQAQQMMMPTVLASCCETIWFPRDMDPDKPHLTASLWLYCGAHGMKVWLPVFPREGDHGHTFMSKRIMLHFPIDKLYPLAILFEDAIILGAENDTMLMSSKSTPADHMTATAVPFSTLERNSLLFLHPILRQLIRRNLGYHAWEIARTCMMLPYFQHSLELLLHEVLEEEATSTEPIPDALLPSVVEFIQEFSVFHRTIGRCARKTEVALWPHLFAVVGSPRTLFMECLSMKDLETASSYLLILQNLEPPAVAQNHATLLLDSALDTSNWELAKELVRFLRTIDPEELECMSPRQLMHATHYGKANPNQTPPIKPSAPEEEISLLLGTLQVPRGRSASYQGGGLLKGGGQGQLQHRDLNRSKSTVDHVAAARHKDSTGSAASGGRSRKTSASDGQATAEEFFIDVILQRHARKLLSGVRLFDLGTFAAQLDFHMVTWLRREALRAARVDSFVPALKKVHADFAWPFPILLHSVVDDLKRKQSAESSGTGSINSPFANGNGNGNGLHAASPSSTSTASDHPTRLESERSSSSLQQHRRQSSSLVSAGEKGISDSGYVSHSTNQREGGDFNGNSTASDQNNLLSEQIIHAMLKPRPQSYREDSSIISDDGGNSITSPDELLNGEGSWPASPAMQQQHLEYVQQQQQTQQDVVSKGPQKSEIQLRYLLQLMLEANCLELASIISVVLKDALALIRIVNAARTSSDAKVTVSRLYHSLKSLEAWAQASCHGYMPFFRAIQPQLNSLKSFLNFQTPPVSPQHSKMEFRRATMPPGGAIGADMADVNKSNGGAGGSHSHPHPLNSVFQRASTQNLLHRARKKTQQVVISRQRRSLPSKMTGTAVMSPVVKEEQREMARRNTVNEDREEEYETAGAVLNGEAVVLGDDEAEAADRPALVRSASVPLDPKEERDEYDTRSVTSEVLPEGQDEQPGCVIA